ncbi:MAG: PEP-CTERM sorting domain-containing protein [Burkholderiales bacterium]
MSKFKKIQRFIGATVLACGAMTASSAEIRIDDLGNGVGVDLTISDGSLLDLFSSTTGLVGWAGTLGIWTGSIAFGTSNALDVPTQVPEIHLTASGYSTGAGSLVISFSDNGFVGTGALTHFLSGVGGANNPGGTVSFSTYVDTANTLFGTTGPASTLLYGSSGLSGADFSGGSSVYSLVPDAPYALTLATTLNHTQRGTSSADGTLRVPEPGTLGLLGAMLLAAGFVGTRRRVTGDAQSV